MRVGRNHLAATKMDLPAHPRCAIALAATSRHRRGAKTRVIRPGPGGKMAIEDVRRKVPAAGTRMVLRHRAVPKAIDGSHPDLRPAIRPAAARTSNR